MKYFASFFVDGIIKIGVGGTKLIELIQQIWNWYIKMKVSIMILVL